MNELLRNYHEVIGAQTSQFSIISGQCGVNAYNHQCNHKSSSSSTQWKDQWMDGSSP